MTPSVLMVGNFLSAFTGGRSVCEELAPILTARGWRVTTASRRVPRFQRLADMVGTTLLNRGRYDVALVDVYSGPAFFWAEAVASELRLLRCPTVLVLRGGNLPAFSTRYRRRASRLLQGAAAVIAPSAYLREQMMGFRADIRLIPNALRLDDYTFRERFPVRPRLVWLRALHSIYNPTMAVDTVHRLIHRFHDVELRIIGPDKKDGSYEATLARIRELGLGGRVTLIGAVQKSGVAAALDWGDIFLNTTNIDNTPVTVLEAMASGLCVVSTDVGGIPYLLNDGLDALLVTPNDPQRMADAVTRILNEPDLAASLRRRAYRMVQKFRWDVVVPRWEHLLLAVGSRQTGGGGTHG